MSKRIILISSMLFFMNCTYHVIREPDKKIGNVPLSEKSKSAKIALIGFYPFKSYVSAQRGRTTTYTAVLNYANSTKSLFAHGKKIEDFPASGIDTSVSEEKVKAFIGSYLENVKNSGLNEIAKVIDLKEEGDKKKIFLKKRDVDFYIIGIHGPPFETASAGGTITSVLTAFPFILTLGTFPLWRDRIVESTFLIYDKNLNLVKKKEFKNNYDLFIAWWGDSDQGGLGATAKPEFTVKLYQPDVIDFSNEFEIPAN